MFQDELRRLKIIVTLSSQTNGEIQTPQQGFVGVVTLTFLQRDLTVESYKLQVTVHS